MAGNKQNNELYYNTFSILLILIINLEKVCSFNSTNELTASLHAPILYSQNSTFLTLILKKSKLAINTVLNTSSVEMLGNSTFNTNHRRFRRNLFLRGSENMINNNQHLQKFMMPQLHKVIGSQQLWLEDQRNNQYSNAAINPSTQSNFYQHQIIKPSPSEYLLPISDLQENPDPKYDPKPSDANPVKLKTLLGRRYDARFMSPYRPQNSFEHPNGTLYFGFRQNNRGLPYGNRIAMYKLMNMNFKMAGIRRKLRLRVSRKIKRKLYKYLTAYTSCPVMYKWKYIGKRFWPNWILEGQCYGAGNEGPAGPEYTDYLKSGSRAGNDKYFENEDELDDSPTMATSKYYDNESYGKDMRRFIIRKRGISSNDKGNESSVSKQSHKEAAAHVNKKRNEERNFRNMLNSSNSEDDILDKLIENVYYDYDNTDKRSFNTQTSISNVQANQIADSNNNNYFQSPNNEIYNNKYNARYKGHSQNIKEAKGSLNDEYQHSQLLRANIQIDPLQRSCSIPPGMTCKPSTSINLTLLRWYCQTWNTKMYCSWITVQYPVIESCKCSV